MPTLNELAGVGAVARVGRRRIAARDVLRLSARCSQQGIQAAPDERPFDFVQRNFVEWNKDHGDQVRGTMSEKTSRTGSERNKPIAIYYEQPNWFVPLFQQMDARGVNWTKLNARYH